MVEKELLLLAQAAPAAEKEAEVELGVEEEGMAYHSAFLDQTLPSYGSPISIVHTLA